MDDSTAGGASLPSGPDGKKLQVTYFYEPTIGDYYHGEGHPVEPRRIRMAHTLVMVYFLDREMDISHPSPVEPADICSFHSKDYVDFLATVSPDIIKEHTHANQLERFNISEDCPVFDALFQFCKASAGGSIGSAVKLNNKEADITINWAGGLQHANKSDPSGFCYVNDVVLAILELLKVYNRVLYVDIDIHHGDSVEEAFFTNDKVMTVSFHKFGDYFFPGTGHIPDNGIGEGMYYYSLNARLKDGIDDENFRNSFPVIQKVIEVYQRDAILQFGAHSLAGDKLGSFNLSVKGHADCLCFLRSFNLPLMVLGGGGYTLRNVACCWYYETAVAVGVEPDAYFVPDHSLHVEQRQVENKNSREDLEKIRNILREQLSTLPDASSIQFHTTFPGEKERIKDRVQKLMAYQAQAPAQAPAPAPSLALAPTPAQTLTLALTPAQTPTPALAPAQTPARNRVWAQPQDSGSNSDSGSGYGLGTGSGSRSGSGSESGADPGSGSVSSPGSDTGSGFDSGSGSGPGSSSISASTSDPGKRPLSRSIDNETSCINNEPPS